MSLSISISSTGHGCLSCCKHKQQLVNALINPFNSSGLLVTYLHRPAQKSHAINNINPLSPNQQTEVIHHALNNINPLSPNQPTEVIHHTINKINPPPSQSTNRSNTAWPKPHIKQGTQHQRSKLPTGAVTWLASKHKVY